MAAVEVTISGVMYDKVRRTSANVVIFGEASLTGLGVGGGPIDPGPGLPGDPVHIWGGGNVPMPSPPIANVPGLPPMGPNFPSRPGEVVPPMPPAPPQAPDQPKPPAENNGWGWSPAFGWGYFPPNQAVPKSGS